MTDDEDDDVIFKRTFYNDEVLAIAADYARLLNEPKFAGVGNEKASANTP